MQNRLIFSIGEVFTKYLQGEEKFVIPPYQRGYKWGDTAVRQLLNDIYDFNYMEDSDEFYCLQNITIVKRKRKDEDDSLFIPGYNVIDGQQRLTTALIILSCLLSDEQLIQFKDKLKYDIREKSEEFLQKYILEKNDIHDDWSDFLKAYPLNDYNHQDIYYLYTARKSVESWLQQKKGTSIFDIKQFALKFLDRVKFIVNLPDVVNENDLFSNLNGNKVNLDGADLLRAIIITRVPKNYYDLSCDEIKQVVLLNEQRARIGIELDRINQWWQDENKQRYFRILTKSLKSDNSINIKFEDEIYPIDILYKLFVLTKGSQDDRLSLLWFENYFKFLEKDFANNFSLPVFYGELLDLQRLIEDFYEDKIIYHLLIYIHIYGGLRWKEFVDKWHGLNSRVAFYEWLKDCVWKIIHSFNLDNINPASEESSDNTKNIIRRPITALCPDELNIKFLMSEDFWSNGNLPAVCILIDIIDVLGKGNATDLPSLKAEYFSVKSEDKEHIFPQTPIEKYKNSRKDRERQIDKLNRYLEIVKNYLNKQKIPIPQDLSLCQNIDTWSEDVWNTKINEINTAIKQVIPIGSLGNMCLLDGNINKSYGNDFFTEKRFDIIHKSRSTTFIRPHVLDAFDKSFANNNQRSDMSYMSVWTIEDIFLRRQNIINQINKFLE